MLLPATIRALLERRYFHEHHNTTLQQHHQRPNPKLLVTKHRQLYWYNQVHIKFLNATGLTSQAIVLSAHLGVVMCTNTQEVRGQFI